MKISNRNKVLFAICIVMCYVTSMGSFLQMQLDQDTIYSPSTLVVTTQFAEKAILQGQWRVDLTVFANKELVRKQTLPITREKPAVFELEFPEIREVISGRCRTELFLDGEFVEGEEKKLRIWTRPAPYSIGENRKIFWAYDTSGRLQDFFKSIEVDAIDATFQSARDFSKPDIIFIGENTDPNQIKVISKHLQVSRLKPVIVCLAQKQLEENSLVEVSATKNISQLVKYDKHAGLLKGFSSFDILSKIANAVPIKIGMNLKESQQLNVVSYIADASSDNEIIFSYLSKITERGVTKIYCQLPITNDIAQNPISRKLFYNLLDMTIKQTESTQTDTNVISNETIKEENKIRKE